MLWYYKGRSRQLVSFENKKLHKEIRTYDINASSTLLIVVFEVKH